MAIQNEEKLLITLNEIVTHNTKQMEEVEYDQGNAKNLYDFSFEEMSIWNPFTDETARFEVNPIDYYGLETISNFVKNYLDNKNLNLKEELLYLGFTSVSTDDEDFNDVYVKVYFKYKDKKGVVHSDGRKEFTKDENSLEPYTKKHALNEAIKWVKEPKENWELVL